MLSVAEEAIVDLALRINSVFDLQEFFDEYPQFEYLSNDKYLLDELALRNGLPTANNLNDLINYSKMSPVYRLIEAVKNNNYGDVKRLFYVDVVSDAEWYDYF